MRLFDVGSRAGGHEVHDRLLTVPNAVTAVRLAGLPVFVWLVLGPGAHGWALALLAGIGATDWVDGYAARRLDQVSRIGTLLDPLVDRALVVTASLTLLVAGIVPAMVVAAVIARDVLLLGGAMVLFGRIPPIAVTRTGKTGTALLLAALPAFLAADVTGIGWLRTAALVLSVAGIGAYYGAGTQYAREAFELRRRSTA